MLIGITAPGSVTLFLKLLNFLVSLSVDWGEPHIGKILILML